MKIKETCIKKKALSIKAFKIVLFIF